MTSIEVDTIKQHEKTAIAANKKDLLFYFYLLAMLTALFLRNAKGVNIPVAFFLFLLQFLLFLVQSTILLQQLCVASLCLPDFNLNTHYLFAWLYTLLNSVERYG